MGDWPPNALHFHIMGIEGHFVPCCPPGREVKHFRLRSAGYRGNLGKRSMGREPGPCIKEKNPGN